VALFHFNEIRTRDDSLYDQANRWGWLGVTVFFVLSGYCVWLAAQRAGAPRRFLLRRFARIYPPYLASVLVVIAFCCARKLITGTNDFTALPASPAGWLATFTMTTAPVTTTPTINWVYSSLSYEAFFYLALAAALIWPRASLPLLFALCVAGFFPAAGRAVFFLPNWGQFALGVALAIAAEGQRRAAAALAVLGFSLVCYHRSLPEVAATGVTAGLIALAPRLDAFAGWLLAILARVGEISYSLYLLHIPVGAWVVERFIDSQGWRNHGLPARLACDAAALAASLLAAAVFHRWIERPAMEWGRRVTPVTRPLTAAGDVT
jgi:peptidoglycan/LPS O-acetylase OafA/YrhL